MPMFLCVYSNLKSVYKRVRNMFALCMDYVFARAASHSGIVQCSVLCSALQCSLGLCSAAVKCNIVQFRTVKFGALQYRSVQYSAMQWRKVKCSAVQYSTVQCSAVQCNAVEKIKVQYSTVQYSTVQCKQERRMQVSKVRGKNCTHPTALLLRLNYKLGLFCKSQSPAAAAAAAAGLLSGKKGVSDWKLFFSGL